MIEPKPHPDLADSPVLIILSRNNQDKEALLAPGLMQVFPRALISKPASLEEFDDLVASTTGEYRMVMAVGGDGTLNRLINSCDIENQVVGLLPMGTGNDLSRTIKYPQGLEERIAHLSSLQAKPTDYCTANGLLYHNSGGFGLDVRTLRLREEKPGFWTKNYNLAFLQALFTIKCPTTRIKAADRELEEPFYWVLAMNNQFIGGGTKIAPKARIDDGLLDVVLIRKTGKARMLALLPSAIKGTHIGKPEVEYVQAETMEVTSQSPIEFLALDGELYPIQGGTVTFRCIRHGMQFLR